MLNPALPELSTLCSQVLGAALNCAEFLCAQQWRNFFNSYKLENESRGGIYAWLDLCHNVVDKFSQTPGNDLSYENIRYGLKLFWKLGSSNRKLPYPTHLNAEQLQHLETLRSNRAPEADHDEISYVVRFVVIVFVS
jgi:hypothetical protein